MNFSPVLKRLLRLVTLGIAITIAPDGLAGAVLRDFPVRWLTPGDELSQNTVDALYRDRDGFLWIGTQGGLHRFDGQRVVQMGLATKPSEGMPEALVTAIGEDEQNKLWVGFMAHGIRYYNRATDRLEAPSTIASDTLNQLGAVRALVINPGKGLMIGSEQGLGLLDSDGKLSSMWQDEISGNGRGVLDLVMDPGEHQAWFASASGLMRVKLRNGEVRPDARWPGPLRRLALDGTRLWIADERGAWQLDSKNLNPVRIWPAASAGENATATVLDMELDAQGKLWLSVDGHGVVQYHPESGATVVVHANPAAQGELPEAKLPRLLNDASGLMWLGGTTTGVSQIDTRGARFSLLQEQDDSGKIVPINTRSLYADATNRLWIGTDDDGLKLFDPLDQSLKNLTPALRASAKAAGIELPPRWRVFGLASDGSGGLWMATSTAVHRIDQQTLSTTHLPLPDGVQIARAIAVTRDGAVWIGTQTHGLYRYDPRIKQFQHFSADAGNPNSLWHPLVLALREDHEGQLWIGTLSGIHVMDIASTRIERVRTRSDANVQDIIRAIHIDERGLVWIGSHNGLLRLGGASDARTAVQRIGIAEGLADQTIYGILEAPDKNLWLSTNRGVSRYDPETRAVENFTRDDGLQRFEFNGGAFAQLPAGRMAFGGAGGVNLFHTKPSKSIAQAQPLRFTTLEIDGQRQTLTDPAAFLSFTVPSQAKSVILEFANPDWIAARADRYEFQLGDAKSPWIGIGKRQFVTLNNLSSGKERLRVRPVGVAENSPRLAAVEIAVRSPWWRTRYAVLAAGLLVLALGVGLLLQQRRLFLRERQYRRELQQREEHFRLALWGNSDEFWIWDLVRDKLLRVGADRLLGFEHRQEIDGAFWREKAVHPDDLPMVVKRIEDHLSGKTDYYESEHRIRNVNGQWTWVMSRGKVVERDDHGVALKLAGTARDITTTLQSDRERRVATEVLRCMNEAVTVSDLDFRFISVNPAFSELTGYAAKEVLGLDASILNGQQHSAEFFNQLRRELNTSGRWRGEAWQRKKNGDEILCSLDLSEVRDANGLRTHWIAMFTDITDRKRAEQELRYLANYDTLTGLPNRTLLGERLSHALLRARRIGTKVAVLFLDLDRFKHVNDSLGHSAGDRLLKMAAQRLRATVRESDTVARLGGDEFTVVLEDLNSMADAEAIARKLIEVFEKPLEVDRGQEIIITPSIGISIFPDHGQVPTDLLKYADTAMYAAKENGRNTYQTYNAHMDALAQRRALMINHLRRAAERNEFSLEFQPKLRLSDRRIIGVEALLRWNSPALGQVPPAQFIPLAEEAGLIVSIGEWVLREACRQVVRFNHAGYFGLHFAVNISALQLAREDLSDTVSQILQETGAPAHQLELELTESVVMSNAEQTTAALNKIRALGVTLSIDDFGTGYSSLSYLKRLPIDSLKIDRTFVRDINEDPDDAAITSTVIMMAHAMGLKVVAEGVETAEQMEYLHEQRCDIVQGYHISPPLGTEACLAFISQRSNDLFERNG